MIQEKLITENEYTIPLSRAAIEAGVSQATLRRKALGGLPHRRRGLDGRQRFYFREQEVRMMREAYVIGYDPA